MVQSQTYEQISKSFENLENFKSNVEKPITKSLDILPPKNLSDVKPYTMSVMDIPENSFKKKVSKISKMKRSWNNF